MRSLILRLASYLLVASLFFYLGHAVARSDAGNRSSATRSGDGRAVGATVAAAGKTSSASDRAGSAHPSGSPLSLAEQTRLALEQIKQQPACEQREVDRLKLLQALAATDPKGALEYAKQNLKRDRLAQALSGIATEWAKHDPVGAWDWARSLGTDEVFHAHTVMEEISRGHPDQAALFVSEFARQQPQEAVAMSLTAMRGMTETGNFDGARKFAANVPLRTVEDQGVLLNFMAGQWARFEPEKTAQWVQSLPEGPLRNQALIGLGESWAEVDSPKAAEFAVHLPTGEQRQLALKQAISNWIVTAPTEASDWVDKLEPSPDLDQAVASVATMRALIEEKVEIALSWANSIYNEPLKVAALSEILSQWSTRDHAAAINYVKSLPSLAPESRQQLLKQLQPQT